MKKTLLVTSSLLSVLLIAGMVVVAHNATSGSAEREAATTVSCARTGADHHEVIANNALGPETTVHGVLCDTLTITNEDNRLRLMAFGQHDHHQAYDGITSKVLAKGESLTVTMNKTGEYTFHDHLQDAVVGYFVVTK